MGKRINDALLYLAQYIPERLILPVVLIMVFVMLVVKLITSKSIWGLGEGLRGIQG